MRAAYETEPGAGSPHPPGNHPLRIAGCDLGKAAAKFVIVSVDTAGAVTVEAAATVAHEGRALDAFLAWYEEHQISDQCLALGATGLHADKLATPAISGLPEDACVEAALDPIFGPTGALNVLSVGARGYSVLTRSSDGSVQFLENDKCSSGTGETMVRIAGRFGLSIREADDLARATEDKIPITARCSVFAKSEMTHFGNQGKPADALFRGYFGSVANYVSALLARGRVAGPVYATGGGAEIRTLVTALSEAVGEEVHVPNQHRYLEAIGAALVAAGQLGGDHPEPLPADPAGMVRTRSVRFQTRAPAVRWGDRVTRLAAPRVVSGATGGPTILGLDLGSTGSKAVLTSIETGEAVLDVYDRTRGNPVDATQRLIRAVLERDDPEGVDVRAIALTGSGRQAAATVLQAAFPDGTDRIMTLNEIVAHATAAIRCDADGGEDLSVVEIGGQDAKFIQVRGGRIVESDMNKACSAGTGSFLEEQANFYGVADIEEFTRQATAAQNPPDLGQMCTVFVAEAAAEAHNEGFDIPELFAGFQYSVIHNYIDRVMGQRTFGRRIFFQGKPATGESLAWTLAAVADRDVVVPPNPGAMGAWGIGLCALEELGKRRLLDASAFELARSLESTVVDRGEFQCRDKRCATLCNIERTKISVGGSVKTVLSGGACPKYEVAGTAKAKLPLEAPSAFDERARLLAPYLEQATGGGEAGQRVGIPLAGACTGWIPWLVTFVRELGLAAHVLEPDARSLSRGEELCYSFDACAPVKVAHGVLAADIGTVLFPKILDAADRDGPGGVTCPMEQGMPDMIREALRARGHDVNVVAPALNLRADPTGSDLLTQLLDAAGRLDPGISPVRVATAMRRAAAAQHEYEADLAAAGERTLAYGHEHGVPVVTVCGPLHVIHDPVVSAGIPRLLRENGVLALPMDCYPIPEDTPRLPRAVWTDANRALRTVAANRAQGDAFPLLLSSFGCGPGSFVEQIFAALAEDYPHTTLESDGHGGTAGYATRVQAFLHTVRRHDGRPAPAPSERLRWLEPLPNPPIADERDARFIVFTLGDRPPSIVSAAYRAHGLDAVPSGPSSPEVLAAGRRDCSGKECLPYQLLWGAFRKQLEDDPSAGRSLLVQATGEGKCRNCMFSVKDQISLERLDVPGSVALRDFQPEPTLGPSFMSRIAAGLTAWDILFQLRAYHRPFETEPGEVDDLYGRWCDIVEHAVERTARAGPLASLADSTHVVGELLGVVRQAALEFAQMSALGPGREDFRTVLLSGDFYVRMDEFAAGGIIRRLNERGILVAVEPMMTFMDYLSRQGLRELARFPASSARGKLVSAGLRGIRRRFYARIRDLHPWMPTGDVPAILDASGTLLDKHPQGEAPITVGSVLHTWTERGCDGAVIVSPWGCGPSLVAESLLRHQREIPMLFIYNDGSPIDERRLNAFAFRLRRDPPRAPVHGNGHRALQHEPDAALA